jgi:predicted PurR-regulated permease PerM
MHSLPLQVTVLLSLMLWGSMWGPVGMVLSVSTHGP